MQELQGADAALRSRESLAIRGAPWLALWLALIAVAAWKLDLPIATWVRNVSPADAHPGLFRDKWKLLGEILRLPGHFYFTAAVALLLSWRHAHRWRSGVLLCIAGALSGIIVWTMKWLIGRQRPRVSLDGIYDLQLFRGGLKRLFTQENLSFPSGDVCLAFATAACLAIWFPRWRIALYAGAVLVAVQRILSHSHWLSDTLAAAGIGVMCVPLAKALYCQFLKHCERPWTPKSKIENRKSKIA